MSHRGFRPSSHPDTAVPGSGNDANHAHTSADDTPWLEKLRQLLFADASEEDRQRFNAQAQEYLAGEALKLLRQRVAGRPQVRVQRLRNGRLPPGLGGHTLLLILNDDMPFLVDSVLHHLAASGMEVRLLLHPVLQVQRSADGALLTLERRETAARRQPGIRPESLMLLLLEPLAKEQRRQLRQELLQVLAEVHDVVLDHPAMRQQLEQVIEAWQELPPPVPVADLTEMLAFLQWLAGEHFVFLGSRRLRRDPSGRLVADGPAHGLLRRRLLDEISGDPCDDCACLMPCRTSAQDAPLLITKSAAISRVHRRAPMDLIIVRLHDMAGQAVGELRLLGLFTSAAYVRAAQDIPLLRRKVMAAMRLTGADGGSHRGKALLNILQTFPRDDLFELPAEELARLAVQVLQVQERPRPCLLLWSGCSPLFVSAFAFFPRERFSSRLREQVAALLETELGARVVQFTPQFGEHMQVRVHYRLQLLQPETADRPLHLPDAAVLNERLLDIVRSWEERLLEHMRRHLGTERADALWPLYRNAFSEAYKEAYSPAEALADVQLLEKLAGSAQVEAQFQPLDEASGGLSGSRDAALLRLKLYHFGAPVPLAQRVPMLAHMGLLAVEERTFTVHRGDDPLPVFLHEMLLRPSTAGGQVDLKRLSGLLREGFLAVWNGEADDDRFNALMINAAMPWRQIVVLRALARWLRQAGVPYSSSYMAETLNRHAALARRLWEMFEALLAPGRQAASARRRRAGEIRAAILQALAQVPSLDEDRIIRMMAQTIMAMQRCNYWQSPQLAEGAARPLAFKLRSSDIDFIPDPKPWAEVFVHAPDMEGVHLRGGPIARGGIRFSDRPQDFRTEILGLMKAQTVKNAVIVPVGAKGGFVLRQPPAEPAALRSAGQAAYERFIATLLDITDNVVDGRIRPPRRLVRLDGDDPYLVVAADKGTATFSDLANTLALARNFWLGDAFASGGSSGYDHKKMGITARGAWVCVRRHFRELGIDIDTTSISVIGVGDMSGDVFGNGMLIQPGIRLLAAFDHRDIFIDPEPDVRAAAAERRRLFRLPRSSWQDYDRSIISAGGGVFSRRAKSIALSPQMQKMLGVQVDAMTPDELIRAILQMPADLLWFGGIGTFVRDAQERDADVGDPANDAVRITADALRVKVVGEGANLGMTQKARITFARAGGRVNMDAIDNAGGVSCSDIEVNIKIALNVAMRRQRLELKERNALLTAMEPAVRELVLQRCLRQAVCISVTTLPEMHETPALARLMRALEERGVLDRQLEQLPSDAMLEERLRSGEGLTRPEVAVLMSWAKIVLFDDLLACGVVDDAHFADNWLPATFPPAMRKRFAEEVRQHPLRQEIIASVLGNAMIDLGGPAFVHRLQEETGRDVHAIATAFAVACALFDLPALVRAVDALDRHVSGMDQVRLQAELRRLLRRACQWLLRHEVWPQPVDALVHRQGRVIEWLRKHLAEATTAHVRTRLRQRRQQFRGMGVPATLARQLAQLPYLLRGMDIAQVQAQCDAPLKDVARIYFLTGTELRLSAVIMAARRLEPSSHEERLACNRLLDRLMLLHARMAVGICRQRQGAGARQAVAQWMKRHEADLARLRPLLDEALGEPLSLPRLMLAVSLFEELAEMADATAGKADSMQKGGG